MVTAKDIIEAMSTPPSAEEKALIERAYNFAAEAHKDQKRFSGEPYMVHLARVAKSLAEIGMGPKTITAGLLHDTIEDTGVEPATIEREFGKEILFLVEGVTKLGHLKYRGTERHRESLRKLLVATSKDTRVLIIKLMDRLHNMRTLQYVKPEKQKRIALETLEIYAAIAHRLGMGVVRKELEDLAFQYAYPEEYANAKRLLTERTQETQERLEDMLRMLKKELAKENITNFHTDFRVRACGACGKSSSAKRAM
jgi:GTP pyrophosphokinase